VKDGAVNRMLLEQLDDLVGGSVTVDRRQPRLVLKDGEDLREHILLAWQAGPHLGVQADFGNVSSAGDELGSSDSMMHPMRRTACLRRSAACRTAVRCTDPAGTSRGQRPHEAASS
jgi:hypothetical protein